MKKKIIVTGGSGRFGSYLKRVKTQHKFFFPTKKQLNILSENSIIRYLKKLKEYFDSFSWIIKAYGNSQKRYK